MLTDLDKATLDLERRWWKHEAVKAGVIRDLFDESATRYYQRVNALIDRPEALAYDPHTVGRLRRLREKRAAARRSVRAVIA